MRNGRGKKQDTWLWGKLLAAFVGLLLLCLPLSSVALTPIDPTRSAELTVELYYESTALPGGRFSLYRIGDIAPDGTLTRAPAYASISISDPQSRSPCGYYSQRSTTRMIRRYRHGKRRRPARGRDGAYALF